MVPLSGQNSPTEPPLVARFSSELTAFWDPRRFNDYANSFRQRLSNRVSRWLHRRQFSDCPQPAGAEPSYGTLLAAMVLAQGFGMTGLMLSRFMSVFWSPTSTLRLGSPRPLPNSLIPVF